MSYEHLLAGAPDHNSPEFLQYLRENNKVVFENFYWLVIENYKYHSEEKPWHTAFYKLEGKFAVQDLDNLFGYSNMWDEWEWLKKSADNQTVKRFHLHLHR